MTRKTFHSPGKLLLAGEYVVLDGAMALAIPTRYGQSMEVIPNQSSNLVWNSKDDKDEIWFQEIYNGEDLSYGNTKNSISDTLQEILGTAKKLNPSFLEGNMGFDITTYLDFPRDWGLGTSSTLIHNIAEWAQVDAHVLLKNSFGGSGYDVAVAKAKAPILYTVKDEKPRVEEVALPWGFTSQLYFIHLNEKQDSKEGIERYRNSMKSDNSIDRISEITQQMTQCTTLSDFSELLELHESCISEIVELPTIKSSLFPDYTGAIKSLGAWGGDFVLVVAEEESDLNYFRNKGYDTIIPYNDMIL